MVEIHGECNKKPIDAKKKLESLTVMAGNISRKMNSSVHKIEEN